MGGETDHGDPFNKCAAGGLSQVDRAPVWLGCACWIAKVRALPARQINSDDVLSRLTVPVLVTHGHADKFVQPSMAEHILQVCPTARASWYDGVGHTPFMEDAERFNRELAGLSR